MRPLLLDLDGADVELFRALQPRSHPNEEPASYRDEAAAQEQSARQHLDRVADGVDSIAMTTHGYSGLDRWLFGSVAEKVMRHCTCPLLVQRENA